MTTLNAREIRLERMLHLLSLGAIVIAIPAGLTPIPIAPAAPAGPSGGRLYLQPEWGMEAMHWCGLQSVTTSQARYTHYLIGEPDVN